jgi:anti-sigma B factor antagonist
MNQEVTVSSNQVHVVLSGSIFSENAKAIQEDIERYIERGFRFISIDFSGVDYINAAGLGTVAVISKRLGEKEGNLKIQGLHGVVKILFELTMPA